MWKQNLYISPCIVLVITCLYINVAVAGDVVTNNLKLYVDGTEFFIKAVCYNPSPLGQGLVDSVTGKVGGGFCSPKQGPYGVIESACYDSDYFDGGNDASNRPQTTEGGWFQPAWERDFPLIKSLGANTIRLYNSNPTTKQASTYFPQNVVLPLGKDHIPFMNLASKYNIKVIFPLISDYGMMTSYSQPVFLRLLRWQIDEVGNHPALLMWTFGNELPIDSNAPLIAKLNFYISYIKQYTYAKYGRRIPVTTAVVDLPQSYNSLAATLNVDIFTTNAGYRGVSFTDLWSGSPVSKGWYSLSCIYNKPVLIGELGWMTLNNAATYANPTWFNQLWKDLISHIPQGCIGGAFFEYSDEPLKADVLQQTMGLVQYAVNVTNGHPSTEQQVWMADLATQKPIIFESVRSGSYQGVPYNMNSNVFSLLGTSPTLLGTASDVCAPFKLGTCPGTGNTCSYHGICNREAGLCTCQSGWSGADCSQPACADSCSGRGTCSTTVSPPACSCQRGWTGASCSVPVSSSVCAANCVFGNGNCDANGVCVCYSGWVGHDCSIPDIAYPPTTAAPTAAAPTTAAPTTAAPTTAAPTTAAPTTAAPTTAAPTTAAPTTAAPTTAAPTTAAPTTAAPTTAAPTTSAPSTSTVRPTTPAPTTTATPTTTTLAPTTSSPTTTQPPTTRPTTPAPTTSAAPTTTRAPTTAPTTPAPTTVAPTTPTPTTVAPTTPTPTTVAPTTPAPTTSVPTTTRAPTTVPPTTQPPTTVPPTTQPPTTIAPTSTPTVTTPSRCSGTMQPCGNSCYDPALYICFNNANMCPLNTLYCSNGACYNPTAYKCPNGQLLQV